MWSYHVTYDFFIVLFSKNIKFNKTKKKLNHALVATSRYCNESPVITLHYMFFYVFFFFVYIQ